MQTFEQKPVWLDCDPGHDDAFAMILAGHNPKLKLLGISTVCGNQTVERTTENALKILSISGLEHVDVVKGSADSLCRGHKCECEELHGKTGLDGADFPEISKQPLRRNCILHMYEVISSYPQKVTIVGTAILTNIALLLKTFPEVKENIEEIVLMGGAIGVGNFTPAAEWNILMDPEAAQIVFDSGLKVVMVPLEVTHTALATPEIVDSIESLNSKFSKIIVELLTFFQEAYQNVYNIASPPIHDPCAVAYVVNPEIFNATLMRVDVEKSSEFCAGRTVCDVYGFSRKPKNVYVAKSMDVPEFWRMMLEAVRKANAESTYV